MSEEYGAFNKTMVFRWKENSRLRGLDTDSRFPPGGTVQTILMTSCLLLNSYVDTYVSM